MLKAFKAIPFNKNKEELVIGTQTFYVDVQQSPEYWKDVVIISSNNESELVEISKGLASLKNDPRFKNKFIMLNYWKGEEDKIEYLVINELPGSVGGNEEQDRTSNEVFFS